MEENQSVELPKEEAQRNLASVQTIIDVQKHPNADTLDIVKVLGWQCVAKLGEFKTGDSAVYFEIDSILPDRPEFEFLRSKKFRIKTIKLRGELSQGLVFPLSILSGGEYAVGQDVTEVLGVKKYEPYVPAQLAGTIKGNFPTSLVPKTDEVRVQSEPGLLDEMRGKWCYASIKMDGTSATYVVNNEDTHVCSRNLSLKEPGEGDKVPVYWQMERKYGIIEKLKATGKRLAIQLEICGPGIQKNRMGLAEIEPFVFDAYDIETGRYLDLENLVKVCEDLGLKTVPLLSNFVFDDSVTMDKLIEMAKGTYPNGYPREGIVIRPLQGVYSEILKHRLSFKVVSNEYLLKTDD